MLPEQKQLIDELIQQATHCSKLKPETRHMYRHFDRLVGICETLLESAGLCVVNPHRPTLADRLNRLVTAGKLSHDLNDEDELFLIPSNVSYDKPVSDYVVNVGLRELGLGPYAGWLERCDFQAGEEHLLIFSEGEAAWHFSWFPPELRWVACKDPVVLEIAHEKVSKLKSKRDWEWDKQGNPKKPKPKKSRKK